MNALLSILVEILAIALGILLAKLLGIVGVNPPGDWHIGFVILCIFVVRILFGLWRRTATHVT